MAMSGVLGVLDLTTPEVLKAFRQARSIDRASVRCMYSGEFLDLLWKHKALKYNACGVDITRFGQEARKAAHYQPHGTIWFHDGKDLETCASIVKGCIPYDTRMTKIWDDWRGEWSQQGDIVRGWRQTLSLLLGQGFLRASPELLYLIGERP